MTPDKSQITRIAAARIAVFLDVEAKFVAFALSRAIETSLCYSKNPQISLSFPAIPMIRSYPNILRRLATGLLLLLLLHSQAVTAAPTTRKQLVALFAADSTLYMDAIYVHLHVTYQDPISKENYTAAQLAAMSETYLFESDVLQGYTALVALPAGTSVKIINISGNEYTLPGGPFLRTTARTTMDTAALLVGEPFWMRNQWVVRLQFLPVRWDQTADEMLVMDDIQVQLVVTSPWPKPIPPRPDPYFEPIYQHTLVNYQDGLAWRRPAPAEEDLALGPAPRSSRDDWRVHLHVTRSGLQRITMAELQAAGVPLEGINPRHLQLYWRGQKIPCLIEGEEDGILQGDDALIFYAAPWSFKYDRNDSYWLTVETENGTRVLPRPAAEATISISSYEETTHLEEQNLYYSDLPKQDQADHWFWESIRSGRGASGAKEFPITLAPMPLGPVRAYLRLHALTNGSGTLQVSVQINDYLVGEFLVSDMTTVNYEVSFPHFILRDGENVGRIQVEKVGDAANALLLDWVEITYVRRLQAMDNTLSFDVNWPGAWRIKLTGFTEMPLLWDVTDPQQPTMIAGADIQTVMTDTLEFASDSDRILHYEAATPATMAPVQAHWSPAESNLREANQQADYIIITPGDFLAAAQRLADYRASQGLSVRVALLQDIYDEFNTGIADPEAIRAFLAYALGTWQAPAPAYVVLLGDTHFDPLNYVNTQPSFVPSYLRNVDPWLGEVADENQFTALVGEDPVPDMMIGRLPVRTLDEANLVVDKIITFEAVDASEAWAQTLLVMADNPDSAGDFYALADKIIAQVAPLLQTQRFYFGQNYGTVDAIRQAFLAAWSEGARFINYIGHGQPNAWAGEQFIRRNDLSQLQNNSRPSFLLTMASLTGIFYWPGSQSLQEEMLLLPDGRGVVGYLASTGFGIANGNALINEGFFTAVLHDHAADLGTATYRAKLYLLSQGYFYTEFLVQLYTLIGDPATRVPQMPWNQTLYLPLMQNQQPDSLDIPTS